MAPQTGQTQVPVLDFVERYRVAIEDELRDVFDELDGPPYDLMRYHLGWQDRHGVPTNGHGGKLLRPALCLLSCEALGGDWRQALPAAAALELTHNFTLIHDDVEDASVQRHGRETVWNIWGLAEAINAGDGMFALAHATLLRLHGRGQPAVRVIRAAEMLDQATLRLCEGQHLDLAPAEHGGNAVDRYLAMIEGKTAVLFAASCGIGASLGAESPDDAAQLYEYGRRVGLTFQIQDDFLGIWGDGAKTGKPTGDDLRAGKRTFPVVVALGAAQPGAHNQLQGLLARNDPDDATIAQAASLLEELGAREACRRAAREHAEAAVASLERCSLDASHRQELEQLARFAAEREA